MILVLLFLFIIILILAVSLILMFSTIRFEIINLKITNQLQEKTNNIKKEDTEFKIRILLLDKIPIFRLKLKSNKIEQIKKIYNSQKIKNINYKKIKNINVIKVIKILKIRLKKINLKVNLGVEDILNTTYLVGILSSAISIILPFITNKKDVKNVYYNIMPIYNQKKEYYITLNSIFQIKIVHIILDIIYILKKRGDKNDRTSNRRPYAYSNE